MQRKHAEVIKVDGHGRKVGIAVSRFNSDVTEALLASALKALHDSGVNKKDVTIVRVVGGMELPLALQTLARRKKFDCLIAIGCAIRGETPHFDYVCKTVQEGVLRVGLDHNIPVGFGMLTLNKPSQARSRITSGRDAALAALSLAELKKS